MKKTNVIFQVSSRLSRVALLALLAFLFVGVQNLSAQQAVDKASAQDKFAGPTYIDSDAALVVIDEEIQLIRFQQEHHPKADENPLLVKRGDIAVRHLEEMKVKILLGRSVKQALYETIHNFQLEVDASSKREDSELRQMRAHMHQRFTI